MDNAMQTARVEVKMVAFVKAPSIADVLAEAYILCVSEEEGVPVSFKYTDMVQLAALVA